MKLRHVIFGFFFLLFLAAKADALQVPCAPVMVQADEIQIEVVAWADGKLTTVSFTKRFSDLAEDENAFEIHVPRKWKLVYIRITDGNLIPKGFSDASGPMPYSVCIYKEGRK